MILIAEEESGQGSSWRYTGNGGSGCNYYFRAEIFKEKTGAEVAVEVAVEEVVQEKKKKKKKKKKVSED